ncbi:uncharacterized protein E5676_scaffold177G00410 [Cucumis melo var. makuwa]|uniref:PTB domain-containing engulfment adapter protein 1 n=2 Tax=Cucumis melo TaxID=3656 RepID=A0A5D3CK24_CUCMM|nr:uncharacterized protein E5676_scaffold177G00410 [Cucumis melo var. makuwa]
MATLFTKSAPAVTRSGDGVYVAAVPLRATKGPAQLLASAAYSFNIWDFQHFMVIIAPPSSPTSHSQALVFDFQPKDPEDIQVALAALSGKPVPGVVRERKLSRLPRNKCSYVGHSNASAVEVARKFNETWDTNLRIGHHDCRDYTNGLVEVLLGEENVLERLRQNSLNI